MKVGPKRFNPQMIGALERGEKRATRRIVTAGNSEVQPGRFEHVDLESGRARVRGDRTEIRARCAFASGVRVVTVLPTARSGDIFWVRRGQKGGTRASSTLTLVLWAVEVARVQDMTDQDAREEGVADRAEFEALWQSINGRHSWRQNPWVWVYKFNTHRQNVDDFLRMYEENA